MIPVEWFDLICFFFTSRFTLSALRVSCLCVSVIMHISSTPKITLSKGTDKLSDFIAFASYWSFYTRRFNCLSCSTKKTPKSLIWAVDFKAALMVTLQELSIQHHNTQHAPPPHCEMFVSIWLLKLNKVIKKSFNVHVHGILHSNRHQESTKTSNSMLQHFIISFQSLKTTLKTFQHQFALTTLNQQYYNIDPSVNPQLLSVQRELHISRQKISDYCTETLFTDFSETGMRCALSELLSTFKKSPKQISLLILPLTPKLENMHSQKRGWSFIYFMI